MLKTRLIATSGVVPLGLFCFSMLLTGCERSEQITAYTVPKHESLQTPAYLAEVGRRHDEAERRRPQPKRMIGVIVPQTTSLWFFKVEGPVNELAAREAEVREFLKTVKFVAEVPVWTLPAHWKQLPPAELRFATLAMGGEPALEMSVSKLPNRSELALEAQVVANINRWRNQVALEPIADKDLATEAEKLDLNGNPAYWVNLVGRGQPGAGGMAPLPPQQPAEPVASKPVFEKPAEWTEAPATMFAVVSMLAKDGDQEAKITITSARGDRLSNVNRWRNQVQQEPLTAEGLVSNATKVEVGSHSADMYEMSNNGRTIYGVIVEDQGQTWFVKLDGATPLAERERSRFIAFLHSLHWK